MSNTSSNSPSSADTAPADDRHVDPESTPADQMLGATSDDQSGTLEKDPQDWVTGDEPMTGAQASYLDTLARDAGETLRADLTKAEASEEIERLRAATDRQE